MFMQAKRDKVWTTIGWSLIGNIAGVAVVNYIEANNDSWRSLRQIRKREMMKAGAFIGTVGMFTAYGYGVARQQFISKKLALVEEHSVHYTEQ